MVISLADMKTDETGIIVNIEGGFCAMERIQSMGVRVGKKIKKTGGNFKYGPQTALIDKFKIAIGFGMAIKVMVQVDR